jgi:hypothetical protein
MEIEMVKDPFEYRMFWHVLKYNAKKLDNNDAEVIGQKICNILSEKTKIKWRVKSCVGGKCTIKTTMIGNRNKRKKLKGKIIKLKNFTHFN